MKIKWGALVVDGRGKIGGQVASKNKSGAYMKNKVTPTNPQTSFQQARRAILAVLSSAWRALTDIQRTGWIEGSPNYPQTNEFGDTYYLAGNMLYNQLNGNLDTIRVTAISACPTPAASVAIAIDALINTELAQTIETDIVVPAGFAMVVRATAPFSAGVNNYDTKLRVLSIVVAGATNPVDTYADYEDRFGTPVAGQKIGFAIHLVNITTGQAGVPVKIASITT